MTTYTLQSLAEAGYVMGLGKIGQVVIHMELHYDAYFEIAKMGEQIKALYEVVTGHLDDSIDLYCSPERKKQIDAEMDAYLNATPSPNEDPPELFAPFEP